MVQSRYFTGWTSVLFIPSSLRNNASGLGLICVGRVEDMDFPAFLEVSQLLEKVHSKFTLMEV